MINFKQRGIYENRHFSIVYFVAKSVKEIYFSFIYIIELPIEEGLTVDYTSDYSINDLKEKVNIEFSDVI